MMNREPLSIEELENSLRLARFDEPLPQALARYRQLFQYVTNEPGPIREATENAFSWLRAQLSWDSRVHGLPEGVRSVEEADYRLLFTTDHIDLELMVESQGGVRHIEGEVIVHVDEPSTIDTSTSDTSTSDTSTSDTPPDPMPNEAVVDMVLLEQSDGNGSPHEVKSEPNGRFTLRNQAPGTYIMHILFVNGQSVEIDPLEIS